MEHLFKSGDKVFIRHDLKADGTYYHNIDAVSLEVVEDFGSPVDPAMLKFAGQWMTVDRVCGTDDYKLVEDHDMWFWNDEMFDLAATGVPGFVVSDQTDVEVSEQPALAELFAGGF